MHHFLTWADGGRGLRSGAVGIAIVLLSACSAPSTGTAANTASADTGAGVFAQHCATCHGPAGQGAEPWYPSLQRLAGLRDVDDIVETIITGRFRRAGEINGHTIPIMPAWGQLTDEEVAAIANYIKQNWGADGGEVTPAAVAQTRARLSAAP